MLGKCVHVGHWKIIMIKKKDQHNILTHVFNHFIVTQNKNGNNLCLCLNLIPVLCLGYLSTCEIITQYHIWMSVSTKIAKNIVRRTDSLYKSFGKLKHGLDFESS